MKKNVSYCYLSSNKRRNGIDCGKRDGGWKNDVPRSDSNCRMRCDSVCSVYRTQAGFLWEQSQRSRRNATAAQQQRPRLTEQYGLVPGSDVGMRSASIEPFGQNREQDLGETVSAEDQQRIERQPVERRRRIEQGGPNRRSGPRGGQSATEEQQVSFSPHLRGRGRRMPMGRNDARSFSGHDMPRPRDYQSRIQMDDLRKLSQGTPGRNQSTTGHLGPSRPSMLGSRSSTRRGLGPRVLMDRGDESGSSRAGTTPQKEKKSTT